MLVLLVLKERFHELEAEVEESLNRRRNKLKQVLLDEEKQLQQVCDYCLLHGCPSLLRVLGQPKIALAHLPDHVAVLVIGKELIESQHSSSERRAELEERARILMNKRESKRQAFAEEMIRKQWQDSCDELRVLVRS